MLFINFLTDSPGFLTRGKIRELMRRFNLTTREIRIMKLTSLELSNKEMAEFIHLSQGSIIKINQSIQEKIGAKSKIGMAVLITEYEKVLV